MGGNVMVSVGVGGPTVPRLETVAGNPSEIPPSVKSMTMAGSIIHGLRPCDFFLFSKICILRSQKIRLLHVHKSPLQSGIGSC